MGIFFMVLEVDILKFYEKEDEEFRNLFIILLGVVNVVGYNYFVLIFFWF